MEKGGFIFLSVMILLLIIPVANTENKSAITGSTVTGESVSGDTVSAISVNITVSGPPTLELLHPKNHTYFTSQNLQLNFTSSGEEWVKYSLDSAANVTITGNIKFNTTEGSHSLFLYANNTQGLTTKNVTFFIESSKFNVIYNEYLGSRKGSSTNLNDSSYEDSQNLSGIILENLEFGKINFNSNLINLTDDSDFSDSVLDLDSHTNISFNRIQVNSTAIGNFNKTPTLTLYNLTFTDPRILRDGSVCSSTICTGSTYNSGTGTFVFNVTSFSIYSTEETPVPETPSGTTSSGGGGGGITTIIPKILPVKKGISLSEEDIKVSLKQGQVETKKIKIKNDDTKKLRITIENPRLKEFVLVRESVFDLAPGESKEITIDIISRDDTIPNLYLGKLLVKTEYEEKEILIAIEVETAGALLDARVEIQKEYKEVLPGEEILAEVKLFNLGYTGRVDIVVEYILKDYNGNEIDKLSESLAVETQTNFLKKIKIREDAEYGKYVLYVRALYNDEVASSSDSFEIVQYKVTTKEKIYIVIVVLLVVILSIFVYFTLMEKRIFGKTRRKVDIRTLMKR